MFKKRKKSLHLKNAHDKNPLIRNAKKTWYFLWHDDSIASWLVNFAVAFILIKYLVYPVLGMIFSTTFPIVAVVSSSMEHPQGFDEWWHSTAYCGQAGCTTSCQCSQQDWYLRYNISRIDFEEYPFSQGFNRGDIMVLFGIEPENVELGDVIVFQAGKRYPIIHRVVRIRQEEKIYFETKGDNNQNYISNEQLNEKAVSESQLLGRAVLRIPWLGYIKIAFTEIIVDPIIRALR